MEKTAQDQDANPCSNGANNARFVQVRMLGEGCQGFVQLEYDTELNTNVAIKYIARHWSRQCYKYVLRELLNHQQLSLYKHPHIVEFHFAFLTPNYLGVALEYVDGWNLEQYLEKQGGRLQEATARTIFQQIIYAVDFCFRLGKVHRDIRLSNILVHRHDQNQQPLVKLCDFGFSKDMMKDSLPQTQLGTALFSAPEIFLNAKGQSYDASRSDIWSCGVVLFSMLFGSHPFLKSTASIHKADQMVQLIENSLSGHLLLPPLAESMPGAVDLLRNILVPAPENRFTVAQIQSHPWFQEMLPSGACYLNDLYMTPPVLPYRNKQSPEEIAAIVRAAVSNSGEGVGGRGLAAGVQGGDGAAAMCRRQLEQRETEAIRCYSSSSSEEDEG